MVVRRPGAVQRTGTGAARVVLDRREHVPVHEQDVHVVAWLIPAGERQDLVDRQIHGMQQQPAQRIAHQRHEAPGRIVGPVNPGRLRPSRHRRADETRATQLDAHAVAQLLQPVPIGRVGPCHTGFGIVEEVEVVAVTRRVGCEVQSRAASQIPVIGGTGRQIRQQCPLERC